MKVKMIMGDRDTASVELSLSKLAVLLNMAEYALDELKVRVNLAKYGCAPKHAAKANNWVEHNNNPASFACAAKLFEEFSQALQFVYADELEDEPHQSNVGTETDHGTMTADLD